MSCRWTAPAALSAILLSGCFNYQTVSIAEVPAGTSVRARLTPDEAARVGEILGQESRYIEGKVLSRSDDTVLLRVSTGASQHPAMSGITHQHISLPAQSIQEIEIRRFDGKRTTVVVAAGAGALAAIVAGALIAQKQPEPGPGKGGTDALRAPQIP